MAADATVGRAVGFLQTARAVHVPRARAQGDFGLEQAAGFGAAATGRGWWAQARSGANGRQDALNAFPLLTFREGRVSCRAGLAERRGA